MADDNHSDGNSGSSSSSTKPATGARKLADRWQVRDQSDDDDELAN